MLRHLALPLALLLTPGLQEPAPPAAAPGQEAAPPADDFRPDPAWKSLGKDLWFDPARREVILRARVCLREGYLEHLLCRDRTKEHESVLATEAAPRMIHAGLILAAGEPGHGVRYRPKFDPPAGPTISIEAEWDQGGKSRRIDARQLVKEERSGKPLDTRWVFAGSDMFEDPDTKKVIYAADSGDLITVANFPSAILDVPLASSNSDAERGYVAFTDNIPPLGTRVTLYMRKVDPAADKAAPARPKPAP